ncbi:unnamed protein product, partial [Meganyctiphanes norvegica]
MSSTSDGWATDDKPITDAITDSVSIFFFFCFLPPALVGVVSSSDSAPLRFLLPFSSPFFFLPFFFVLVSSSFLVLFNAFSLISASNLAKSESNLLICLSTYKLF